MQEDLNSSSKENVAPHIHGHGAGQTNEVAMDAKSVFTTK